jgi:hypothetical protein
MTTTTKFSDFLVELMLFAPVAFVSMAQAAQIVA